MAIRTRRVRERFGTRGFKIKKEKGKRKKGGGSATGERPRDTFGAALLSDLWTGVPFFKAYEGTLALEFPAENKANYCRSSLIRGMNPAAYSWKIRANADQL